MTSIEILDPDPDPGADDAPASASAWRRRRLWPFAVAALAVGGLAAWLVDEPTPAPAPPTVSRIEPLALDALDGPVALDPDGIDELWVLDQGSTRSLAGVNVTEDDTGTRSHQLRWLGDELVYLDDAELWRLPSDLGDPPTEAGPGSFMIRSTDPHHVWVVLSQTPTGTQLARFDAGTSSTTSIHVTHTMQPLVGIDGGRLVAGREAWNVLHPDRITELPVDYRFALASTGGGRVFFTDPSSAMVWIVDANDPSAMPIVHDLTTVFPDLPAVWNLCASTDGSHYLVRLSDGDVAVFETAAPSPRTLAVLDNNGGRLLTWVSPTQLVHSDGTLATTSDRPLQLTEITSSGPETMTVATLHGARDWVAQSTSGSC